MHNIIKSLNYILEEAARSKIVLLIPVLVFIAHLTILNAQLTGNPSANSETEDGIGVVAIRDADDSTLDIRGSHRVPWAGRVHVFENQKLVAGDREEEDRFGRSVALSGNRALIGAHRDDDSGKDSGSSYIFSYDGTEWIELEKLYASDGEAGDYFGWAVSISDDVAVIGAYGDDDSGFYAGSAYIFSLEDTAWVEQAKLLASDGQEWNYFGRSVSVSGDAVVVGSWGDDESGSDSGSAYIFRNKGATWVEEAKLLASDGEEGDQFGRSVMISGDVVIIGAWGDDDQGTDCGSAYIYRFNGTAWNEEAKLLAYDGEAYDKFGYAVAVSDDVVIVGAFGDDDSGSWSGSAYIYRYNGSTWIEEAKLQASDGTFNDNFGRSVSISGDVVVVGALFDDPSGPTSGSAYLYRNNGSSWVQEAKLLASDGETNDWFAYSVFVSGDVALIGSLYNDDLYTNSGAAYVFELEDVPLSIPPASALRKQVTRIPASADCGP